MMRKLEISNILIIFSVLMLSFLIMPKGYSTEELAEKTGKDCGFCHLDPDGGGELNNAGKDYLPKPSLSIKIHQIVRLIVGYIHILTGIFWFGTILYVHIVLKPSYAAHGLPRGEVRLGLASMVILAITGVILSIFRIPSLSFLIETRFGILLTIKIALFLIMAGSALFVIFVIGPKLKKRKREGAVDPQRGLTVDDLAAVDGTGGEAAYIAYKGKIYDVSKSQSWKDGNHFGRHSAGEDLTEMLIQAPHGEEKILEMPQAGNLIHRDTEKVTPFHVKAFYFIAHMNLVLVLLIILILALWRWW